jgi:hypothetical protein
MGWTTPRTWVASEVVTDAMLNEQVRDNEGYLKTKADDYDAHKAATSAVHGLGSGVSLVGCKQGTMRLERKQGSASTGSLNTGQGWGGTINVTWDNAFSSTIGLVTDIYTSTGDFALREQTTRSLSTTGASKAVSGSRVGANGTATVYVDFLGIGT